MLDKPLGIRIFGNVAHARIPKWACYAKELIGPQPLTKEQQRKSGFYKIYLEAQIILRTRATC